MRKTALIIFLGVTFGIGLFLLKVNKTVNVDVKNEISDQTPTKPEPTNTQIIDEYLFYDYEVYDSDKITLHSNLQDSKTSNTINKDLVCKFITNAGFYTEEKKHIGLFVEDKKVLSSQTVHNLFNGFVGFDTKNGFYIGKSGIEEKFANAFQTGPMLYENGKIQKLSLKNDEFARRVVVLVTEENKVFFAAFYDPKLKTSGPQLENLPSLLQKYSEVKNIKIRDAINLDGGNHSLFVSENFNLMELINAGGFVCVK